MRFKDRDAGLCNIKLLLLFLMAYGHMIEGNLHVWPPLDVVYRLIYTFHMPLFAFLSGLGLKDSRACFRQALRMGRLYLAAQAAAVLLDALTVRSGLCLWTPWWHLWYLLSLAFWCVGAGLWYKLTARFPALGRVGMRGLLLAGSILAGCLAGGCPGLGRMWSAGRTLVFFPYVWAGLFCPRKPALDRLLRPVGVLCGAVGAVLFFRYGGMLDAAFLYQADGYGALGLVEGAGRRLLCYALAALFGGSVLACAPRRKLPCSWIGADTLPVYLLHAPVVWLLRPLRAVQCTAPLAAALAVWFLARLCRLDRPIYLIKTGGERVGGFSRRL